jgi:hypothetical protein
MDTGTIGTTGSSSKVSPVVTLGSKISGNGPVYVGAGGNAYDGEARMVAFYAVTDAAVDGVYVAPVRHADV